MRNRTIIKLPRCTCGTTTPGQHAAGCPLQLPRWTLPIGARS